MFTSWAAAHTTELHTRREATWTEECSTVVARGLYCSWFAPIMANWNTSLFSSFHPLVEPVASLSIPYRDVSSPLSPPRLASHNCSYRDAASPSLAPAHGAVHAITNPPLLPFALPTKNTDLNVS